MGPRRSTNSCKFCQKFKYFFFRKIGSEFERFLKDWILSWNNPNPINFDALIYRNKHDLIYI